MIDLPPTIPELMAPPGIVQQIKSLPRVIGELLIPSARAAGMTFNLETVMAGIQKHESSGWPWTIHDNTTNKSYRLGSMAEAVAKAKYLISYGNNIDMGLYQINSFHLRRPGITIDNIFTDGVQNSISRTIFMEFYGAAKKLYGDSELAIQRAIGGYNSGSVKADNVKYVSSVLRKMGVNNPVLGSATASTSVTAGFGGGGQLTGSGMKNQLSGKSAANILDGNADGLEDEDNPLATESAKPNESQGGGILDMAKQLLVLVLVLGVILIGGVKGLLFGVKYAAKQIAMAALKQGGKVSR